MGGGASPTASLACVATWHEDFRSDLARCDVPALVIHRDADRIVSIAAAGLRTAEALPGARRSPAYFFATTSTSMWAPCDASRTTTVVRAGLGSLKNVSYTAFIGLKSSGSVKKTRVDTTSE